MFKIIGPKEHSLHLARIEALLDLFKVYHNFELSLEERTKTTFMIAEDEKRGVYGGALLYPRKVGNLYDKIKNIVSTLHTQGRKVWVVNLCLCVEEDEPLEALTRLELCQSFYQNLLKRFMKFGRKKNAKFFILSLHPTASFKEKTYGRWAYLLEIHPKESLDGLFHGILSLKPERKKTLIGYHSSVHHLNLIGRPS